MNFVPYELSLGAVEAAAIVAARIERGSALSPVDLEREDVEVNLSRLGLLFIGWQPLCRFVGASGSPRQAGGPWRQRALLSPGGR
jgi:hypothetical protein